MWLRQSFGEGNGTPLQYSCLENPMDGGAWKTAVHGVAEGQTRLSDFTFTFHFHSLEKEMTTHSSVLAWRIPGMGEPGGLPSMGLHRVRHDWSNLAAAAEIKLGVAKSPFWNAHGQQMCKIRDFFFFWQVRLWSCNLHPYLTAVDFNWLPKPSTSFNLPLFTKNINSSFKLEERERKIGWKGRNHVITIQEAVKALQLWSPGEISK